jgi:2-polyprenyl-3-methyl-5-hydroxy-6-metoxy-1,4-benzoquinol methylase
LLLDGLIPLEEVIIPKAGASPTRSSPAALAPAVVLPSSPCGICGSGSWEVLYRGRIRLGRFGSLSSEAQTVLRCSGCGVGFLPPSVSVDYESEQYRDLVDAGGSPERYYDLHDAEQAGKLAILGTDNLRHRVVADVGCGAGSFLDLVKGLASTTLAIEPTRSFHSALSAKGHRVFSYAAQVPPDWHGRVDTAVCFSVVEHVPDPVALLRDVRRLLTPGGQLLLSTPNLDDWMLELLPEDYGAFFFRTVHSWYFDAESLRHLATVAGFNHCVVQYVHRFDLGNALLWLRDRRPSGEGAVPIAPPVNAAFTSWLESSGRADYLYARLTA